MRQWVRDAMTLAADSRLRPPLLYMPDLKQIPPDLAARFERLNCDDETQAFIDAAGDFSLVRLLISNLLASCFCSRTTANGVAGRGSMFVLSTAQARTLLRPVDDASAASSSFANSFSTQSKTGATGGASLATLLDIGAGDGNVTRQLAPLFDRVDVTEYSRAMQWRLRRRGFTVLDYRDPFHDTTRGMRSYYDVISCLNVLDRADTPLTLLREIRSSLKPHGLLLLAVVLPWCPFVEDGGGQRTPREQLAMTGGECRHGASYEASLTTLVDKVLRPAGWEVVRWSCVPYLCEGNLRVEYAKLNDAVLVLRPAAAT